MKDLVSCVITTYKRELNVLERGLKSVLNQTYPNIEVIIVDDNGENTLHHKKVRELINRYNKENIKLIAHKENAGVQRARNNGFLASNGKYIAFLDDDDIWHKEKIEKQKEIFELEGNENVGLVYCWFEQFTENDNGAFDKKVIKSKEFPKEEVIKELARRNFVGSTSFPLIKKDAMAKVGLFDESLLSSQDYDMWMRIALEFEIRCVPEILAYYIRHSGERISTNHLKKAQAEKDFLKKYNMIIKKDPIAYSLKTRRIGVSLMKTGQGKEARKYFKAALRNNPKDMRIYKYYIESYFK